MATGKKGDMKQSPIKAMVEGPSGQAKSAPKSYNDKMGPIGMRQQYKRTGKA